MLNRTVYEIEHEMSNRELLGWVEYFRRRPPGWKDDQRTSMIVSAFGSKAKPEELFPSIAAIKKDLERSQKKKSVAQAFMEKFGHLFPQLELEE